jgi:hypothetical protein
MNSIYIKSWRTGRCEEYTGTHTIAELKRAMKRQAGGNKFDVYVVTADNRTYEMDDLNEQFAIDYWGGEA